MVKKIIMKIREFAYQGSNWNFLPVSFDDLNLIVGDSGAGKTRLFNLIFNMGTFVAQSKIGKGEGNWDFKLISGDDVYSWHVEKLEDEGETVVSKEQLLLNDKLIVEREDDSFLFKSDKLPKMPRNLLSLSLLKEEPDIKPIYTGFAKIRRRRFFTDDLDKASTIVAINYDYLNKLGEKQDLGELFNQDFSLNPTFYILNKYFPNLFEEIVAYFRETFPFIEDIKVQASEKYHELNLPSSAPILGIKERNVDKWLRLDELSSGMQKVLLILADLFTATEDSIYLIDEYENSLGVSAIHTLPDLLQSGRFTNQVLLTSHHPETIRDFTVDKWIVAHRLGNQVEFTEGKELAKRYGLSNQDKYIQLLNDPEYSGA